MLEAGYRVLAPDQRGYSGPSRPAAVGAYDIHALCGDRLNRVLLEFLGELKP